jgi:hypothetical protein
MLNLKFSKKKAAAKSDPNEQPEGSNADNQRTLLHSEFRLITSLLSLAHEINGGGTALSGSGADALAKEPVDNNNNSMNILNACANLLVRNDETVAVAFNLRAKGIVVMTESSTFKGKMITGFGVMANPRKGDVVKGDCQLQPQGKSNWATIVDHPWKGLQLLK